MVENDRDWSKVSDHIGEMINVCGLDFMITAVDSVKKGDTIIIIQCVQTEQCYIAYPSDWVVDVIKRLKATLENNRDVYVCEPYEKSKVDVPSCYKAALKYVARTYGSESSSEADAIGDLLNLFALTHEDRILMEITNSFSKGVTYNCITNKIVDRGEEKK